MAPSNRSQWDATRFVTTLNHFGEIPFLGSFRWIQQLLGQRPVFPGMTMSAPVKKAVVIGPGASEIANEVLNALQRSLPNSIELVVCPLTFWSANGDNSLQIAEQIRPADSVIVLETPAVPTLVTDVVSYLVSKGLANTDSGDTDSGNTNSGNTNSGNTNSGNEMRLTEQTVFDFSAPEGDLSVWGALDDVVMGGVSQGRFFLKQLEATSEQVAIFAGTVSTDNSGGFSSVRTQNFEPPFDFSGWSGIRLKVRGDGQRYKFIARNSSRWDSPAYIYSFDTVADTWQEVEVPFEALVATFRARSVPEAPAFDPGQVFSFQLMLSKFEYDRHLNPQFSAGPFELAVSRLGVYQPDHRVSLLVVGAQDEGVKSQQQLTLAEAEKEAKLDYQFIDAGSPEMVTEALVKALT